jgi:hypothetical protein
MQVKINKILWVHKSIIIPHISKVKFNNKILRHQIIYRIN